MTTKTEHRPWTDEEYGVIQGNPSATSLELAELTGRTKYAIDDARKRLKDGWEQKQFRWTPEEEAILSSKPGHTATSIMPLLPGRTIHSIRLRRLKLGMDSRSVTSASPYTVGVRTLLAKTCPGCGALLPADRFFVEKKKGTRCSHCRFCMNESAARWRSQNPDHVAEYAQKTKEKERRRSAKWERKMNELTLPNATRKSYPYLESDFVVLADQSLSVLTKAIRLERTYGAVKQACISRGFQSKTRNIGSRADEIWIIDNPNADRVDEITAALKQEFATAGIPFPEWDWDD